jgi:adenylosuccinate lyase
MDLLKKEAAFAKVDFDAVTNPRDYVGRSPEQVDEFVAAEVEPIRSRYKSVLGLKAELHV